ncbi:MAG: peptidase T [Planctomycetota bacterium]|nr:MAG: peptidase T [Planctomycetota bacterium]
MIDPSRLLERFLRYVQVDTTAREGQATYPSSPGQLELGRILLGELRELGLTDAVQSDKGIVMATVPATVDRKAPVVAFNAHVDTSPETTGAGVRPQVVRDYPGGDIPLPGNPAAVIREADNPDLRELIGSTIITSDGTTLLGADDKAGLAVIMETVATLMEHLEIEHGPLRICFTCDEEIGHGVDHVDLDALGAIACYTLDGHGTDEIDVETFSADLATVVVRGVNIHPSIAKGKMINALRVAADFLARLPRETLAPEVTSGREGFLHPYQMQGGVAEVSLRILLRDFDSSKLAELAERLRTAAGESEQSFPGASIEVRITPQYRNMAEGLAREPRAVEFARQALLRLGREPRMTIIRGGTDGSRLTELGLPTPNLSTGEHNPHSPLEWTCLEEMAQAARMLVELVRIWGEE